MKKAFILGLIVGILLMRNFGSVAADSTPCPTYYIPSTASPSPEPSATPIPTTDPSASPTAVPTPTPTPAPTDSPLVTPAPPSPLCGGAVNTAITSNFNDHDPVIELLLGTIPTIVQMFLIALALAVAIYVMRLVGRAFTGDR